MADATATPNQAKKSDKELWGCEAVTITVPANVVHNFNKLHNYKMRDMPATARPSIESLLPSYIAEAGQKAAEYAENQAYLKLERLCQKMAQQLGITVQESALRLKVQLRESK